MVSAFRFVRGRLLPQGNPRPLSNQNAGLFSSILSMLKCAWGTVIPGGRDYAANLHLTVFILWMTTSTRSAAAPSSARNTRPRTGFPPSTEK